MSSLLFYKITVIYYFTLPFINTETQRTLSDNITQFRRKKCAVSILPFVGTNFGRMWLAISFMRLYYWSLIISVPPAISIYDRSCLMWNRIHKTKYTLCSIYSINFKSVLQVFVKSFRFVPLAIHCIWLSFYTNGKKRFDSSWNSLWELWVQI